METATAIKIRKLTEPDELHCWYDGQTSPQPCHLALDLTDGELTAGYNPEVGPPYGTPASVYHGRTLRIKIPCLTADAANRLLNEVAPIAARILSGATIEWDGHNHIGVLDDDAEAAVDELAAACDPESFSEQHLVGTWDAADWYSEESDEGTAERLGITADTTDAELGRLAAAEAQKATTMVPGYTVLRGAESHLLAIRDELRLALRDELEEVAAKLTELTERRNALIRRLAGWGDSSRAIATYAGLSHVRVQQIAAES